MGNGEPRDRVPSAQSPKARRWSETRALNYTEPKPDGASIVNDLYAAVAVPTAQSGDYDEVIDVTGYDYVFFWLEDVTANGATAFHVQPQFAHVADKFSDLYEDEANTGTLVRKIYDLPNTACCWRVIYTGGARFLRAQMWCDGGAAGTRATLKITRAMWA